MASGGGETVYYCTQCQIETRLQKVCPKCHRRTTLVPAGASRESRQRKRVAPSTLAPRDRRSRLVIIVTASAAVIGLSALGWWWLRGQHHPSPKASRPGHPGALKTPPAQRVFGADAPGRRVAPLPPPRRCGTHYRLVADLHRIDAPKTGMAQPGMPQPGMPQPGMPQPGMPQPGMPKAGPPKAGGASPARPFVDAQRIAQEFLLTGNARRPGYLPLSLERTVTVGKRSQTVLRLDRRGALLPDPRARRLVQRGPDHRVTPDTRVSDLIGRVLADLEPDDRGAPRISRLHRRGPMVQALVQSSIALAAFLHPRPPKASVVQWDDRRTPPKNLVPGVERLVRRVRRRPRSKTKASSTETFAIDSPALLMRQAGSTISVEGETQWNTADLLPSKAELTFKAVKGPKGTHRIKLRLERLGTSCNQ